MHAVFIVFFALFAIYVFIRFVCAVITFVFHIVMFFGVTAVIVFFVCLHIIMN